MLKDHMVEYGIKTELKNGMNANVAVKIIELAHKENAVIYLSKDGENIAARSVLSLLNFGIEYKDDIDVTIEGKNAEKVADELNSLLAYAG